MENPYETIEWDELPEETKKEWVKKSMQKLFDSFKALKNDASYQTLVKESQARFEATVKELREGKVEMNIYTEQNYENAKELYLEKHNKKGLYILHTLSDCEDENESLSELITAQAHISGNPIDYLTNEITSLKLDLCKLSMGIDWFKEGTPTISQPKVLEQWFGEDGFTELIEKLQLIDFLEEQRSKLQNMRENELLEKRIHEKEQDIVNKWILVEDKKPFIEALYPYMSTLKGKGLYTLILALQRNKQMRVIGISEQSDFHRFKESVFGKCGEQKSLNDAINSYKNLKDTYIEPASIECYQSMFSKYK